MQLFFNQCPPITLSLNSGSQTVSVDKHHKGVILFLGASQECPVLWAGLGESLVFPFLPIFPGG